MRRYLFSTTLAVTLAIVACGGPETEGDVTARGDMAVDRGQVDEPASDETPTLDDEVNGVRGLIPLEGGAYSGTIHSLVPAENSVTVVTETAEGLQFSRVTAGSFETVARFDWSTVRQLGIDPYFRPFVAAADDRLWTASGNLVYEFDVGGGSVEAHGVAFAPDVAGFPAPTDGRGNTATVITDVAIAGDGSRLAIAVAGLSGPAVLDTSDLSWRTMTSDGPDARAVFEVEFMADGTLLALGAGPDSQLEVGVYDSVGKAKWLGLAASQLAVLGDKVLVDEPAAGGWSVVSLEDTSAREIVSGSGEGGFAMPQAMRDGAVLSSSGGVLIRTADGTSLPIGRTPIFQHCGSADGNAGSNIVDGRTRTTAERSPAPATEPCEPAIVELVVAGDGLVIAKDAAERLWRVTIG